MGRFFEQLLAENPERSQSSIAREMKISPGWVSKLISGEREGIGAELLRKVLEAYRVDPRYFIEDYEGERDYKAYLLDRERNTDRIRSLEERLARVEAREAVANGTVLRRRP